MPKAATSKIGLRASSGKRTLRFGLVNVGIAMGPALDATNRVSAKQLDPDTLTPLKQQLVNSEGNVVSRDSLVKGYEHDGGYVVLDANEVPKLDGNDVIELVAAVDTAEIPSEWIARTNLAWPQDSTEDEGYALVSHYLRSYGKALIGTTIDHGSTQVVAIRWSDTYGCVIAQTLAYHAQVRWSSVEAVREGTATIPDPSPEMAKMAASLLDGLESSFAWDEVEDEYGLSLTAAITEKAATGGVTPAAAAAPTTAPSDLMAALAASLKGA